MIIIPDVHGRSFWKEAIKGQEDEEILFLGDYLDPYLYEEEFHDLNKEEIHKKIMANFNEIIELKKSHSKNVILLLGNHDLHYTSIYKCSRYDSINSDEINDVFENNWDLFQMANEKEINGKRYIFSHAGLSKNWLESNPLALQGWNEDNIVKWVNNAYLTHNIKFFSTLDDLSSYRGGFQWYGSMVWADVREYFKEDENDGLIGDYQIFGHTQLNEAPLVCDKCADLDCRRAFILNEEGNITEINGKIIEKTKL